ncbi:MAG: outer membrane beta-barrel protein [Steroidobacteraceae bacterium]
MRRPRTPTALAAAAVLVATSPAARAEDAPSGPKLADVLAATGITLSGYVAASYYSSNGYPANIHQFDVEHDTFQLDQAGLALAYQPKQGFGGLVDVIAGEDARILHAAEDGRDNTFDIRQAYLQFATGALTLIAGKYLTLAGAEVINPTLNTNFSRSLLFFDSEPLTHTGLRATYAVTDTINIIGGINNGWNTTSTSYGSKTAEGGIAWTPGKMFSLTTQAYFGKSEAFDAEKTLIDVVATCNATSALTLILNFDWDRQELRAASAATWNGAALYVNYAFTDQWRVSVRAEYLDDRDGFATGAVQTLKEGTVTFGYAPVKSFELRLEGRYDKAQSPVFFRSNPAAQSSADLADNLSEIALQGVYRF